MEGAEKYHRQIDPEGQSSVAQLLRWIRPGSKVLEMGPATGIMTKFLAEVKGCDVTCVEVDPKAADHARHFCSKMIVGDLNRTEWTREIEGQEFDYVIFADVLEHLLNPAESLQTTLKHLKSTGEVLISVPNIAYVGIIAELLEGRFDYRRDGLLDETHVHFFTRKSLVQLLGQAGLVSLEWGRTAVAPEFSEFRLQTNQLGAAARGVLAAVPDGDTYQFLVRCARTGIAALPVVSQGREYGTVGLSAQVYFDTGNGFLEENSQIVSLRSDRERQTVHCDFPSGTKVIRFDPIDSVTPVVLHSVTIQAAERVLFSWSPSKGALGGMSGLLNVVEASASGSSVLIPLTSDPAVTILVDGSAPGTFSVECSLNGPEVLRMLVDSIQPLRNELGLVSDHARELERLKDRLELLLSAEQQACQHLRESVSEVDARLQEYRRVLEDTQAAHEMLKTSLHGVVGSKSWQMTRPLRVAMRLAGFVTRMLSRALRLWTRRGILANPAIAKTKFARLLWSRLHLGSDYQLQMAHIEPSARDLTRMRFDAEQTGGPTFSIIMPTYKTNPLWLKQAIESVRQQAYPYWELCIADDASNDPGVRSILSTYAANDPRIKVEMLAENGHISKASNAALTLATGQYIVLLDHDDILAPQALYRLAEVVKRDAEVDVIYSDEDKLSADGVRSEPTCKPGWSPEYFLSFMYTGHISCFRSDLVREVGGFRVGFEGSQDFDLMLRVTERTNRIVHIPEVLYHWRAHVESVAGNLESKPYAFTAAKRAITEALVRRGFPAGKVGDSRARGLYCVERGRKSPLLAAFSVSAGIGAMRVAAGEAVSEYRTNEEGKLVRELLARKKKGGGCIAVSLGGPVPAEVLDRLLDHGADAAIGVASPLVLDTKGNVVAAGMALSRDMIFANFKGLPGNNLGYRGRLVVPFNVSFAYPACLVFKEELLRDVPASVQDIPELTIALCLAAHKRGLRCLVDPSVHFTAGEVGGVVLPPAKLRALLAHYGREGMQDPFLPAGLPLYARRAEMPAI